MNFEEYAEKLEHGNINQRAAPLPLNMVVLMEYTINNGLLIRCCGSLRVVPTPHLSNITSKMARTNGILV